MIISRTYFPTNYRGNIDPDGFNEAIKESYPEALRFNGRNALYQIGDTILDINFSPYMDIVMFSPKEEINKAKSDLEDKTKFTLEEKETFSIGRSTNPQGEQ